MTFKPILQVTFKPILIDLLFLQDYLPPKPGKFICYDTDQILGHHNGYHLFTVGQRSKIGGRNIAYVILHKNVNTGDMLVVRIFCFEIKSKKV